MMVSSDLSVGLKLLLNFYSGLHWYVRDLSGSKGNSSFMQHGSTFVAIIPVDNNVLTKVIVEIWEPHDIAM